MKNKTDIRISKTIITKKNTVEGITLPDFRMY